MSSEDQSREAVINSPEFKKLVSTRWSVSLILTIIILVVYIGFLLLVAYNKEILATRLGPHLTLAIPVGLGIIAFAWILTGIYVYWANNYYDAAVHNLRNKITRK